jgi:tRNA(Ile)-lysidine synthase
MAYLTSISADRPRWTRLHAQVHRRLQERRLLERGQPILVAVSGGQDSLCLLRLLLDLQPKWDWQIAIAHCDHRWRGDVGNAEFVQQIAQAWELPFYLQVADQIAVSEGEAREWRYRALSAIAHQYEFSCVATGHTASDRAETLLYNLLRGSGADGLQALAWKRPLAAGVTLVRPILELTRLETAQFCQEQELAVWHDPANSDLRFTRNRIRHELFPYLQTYLNPQVDRVLAQTAELLQSEVEYLETQASYLLARSRHPEQLALNRHILRQSPLALQRRTVRQFLQEVLPTAPSFEHIEKLLALLPAHNRSQTDPLPGGMVAQVDGDWICLLWHSAQRLGGS